MIATYVDRDDPEEAERDERDELQDVCTAWFTHATQFALLSRAEERALSAAHRDRPNRRPPYHAGGCARCKTPAEALTQHNLLLIAKWARRAKVANPQIDLVDLLQSGVPGLMEGAARYDGSTGYTFATYASWWIRQSMQRWAKECGRPIREPEYVHIWRGHLTRLAEAHPDWSEAELRADMDAYVRKQRTINHTGGAHGLSDDRWAEIQPGRVELMAPVSLDWGIDDDHRAGPNGSGRTDPVDSLADRLPAPQDDVESMPEAAALAADTARRAGVLLEAAIRHKLIKAREARVICLRYGLGTGTDAGLTLEQVGAIMGGISRERVRQLEARAMGALRAWAESDPDGVARLVREQAESEQAEPAESEHTEPAEPATDPDPVLPPVVHSQAAPRRSPATSAAVPVDTTRPASCEAVSAPVRPPRSTSAGISHRAGRTAQTDKIQRAKPNKRATAATSRDCASDRIERAHRGASARKYSTLAQRGNATAIAQAS